MWQRGLYADKRTCYLFLCRFLLSRKQLHHHQALLDSAEFRDLSPFSQRSKLAGNKHRIIAQSAFSESWFAWSTVDDRLQRERLLQLWADGWLYIQLEEVAIVFSETGSFLETAHWPKTTDAHELYKNPRKLTFIQRFQQWLVSFHAESFLWRVLWKTSQIVHSMLRLNNCLQLL